MWPRLPLAALLAAGVAHTALGAPNLCRNEADFTGHAACAYPSESLASFGYWQNPSPAYIQDMSWEDVTDAVCDTATDAAASETARTYVAEAVARLHLHATTCCGAPDKIRCGLSADDTMCKAAADFSPATTVQAWTDSDHPLLGICGYFSDLLQYSARNPQGQPSGSAVTWSDTAMCSTLPTLMDGTLQWRLGHAGPCCGGFANVRCTDELTEVTSLQFDKCDDGVARWTAYDRSVSCCDALTEDGSLNLGSRRCRERARRIQTFTCVQLCGA